MATDLTKQQREDILPNVTAVRLLYPNDGKEIYNIGGLRSRGGGVMDERVEQIRKRLAEATPDTFIDGTDIYRTVVSASGSVGFPQSSEVYGQVLGRKVGRKTCHVAHFYGGVESSQANAELFVRSPSDQRYLLERLDEAVRLLRTMWEEGTLPEDMEHDVAALVAAPKGESNGE